MTSCLADRISPGSLAVWTRRCLRLSCLAALLLLLPAGLLPAAETWSDTTGAYRVEADFLALRGQTVYLKKTNGVTIAVPLARLDAASQQLARRLAQAEAAADTPDAAVRAVLISLETGDLRSVWNALPASYQQDVTGVIRTFGQNMDPDVWNAGTRILKKAVAVLKDKKSFILGYPALQQMGVDAAATENWDLFVGLLETITTSELLDLQQLKTFDVEAFLDGGGRQIGQQMAQVSKAFQQDFDPADLPVPMELPGAEMAALGDLENATITTVQVEGDSATVRVESNGKSTDLQATRVDGKWLPSEMVQGWAEGVTRTKQFLSTEMPEQLKASKQQLLSPLSPVKMVEGVLDQLLATQSQQEFNQVIDGIMQMVGGLMGAPPADGDPFGAPPAGGAAPGAADPFGAPPAGGAAPGEMDPFGAPPAGGAAPGAADPFGAPPADGGAPAIDDPFGF